MKDYQVAMIAFIWAAMGVGGGLLAGIAMGRLTEQKFAIQANAAHWEINAQTGDRTFVYGAGNGEKP